MRLVTAEKQGMRFLWKDALPVLILVVVVVAVRGPSLGNEFAFDARVLVRDNPLLQNFEVDKILTRDYWHPAVEGSGLYRPVTTLTFLLDRWVGGESAAVYHTTNLLLHLLNVLLVYFLVRPHGRKGSFAPLALLAAVLFALHPATSEAVAHVAGRSDLLAAFFVLSSVLVAMDAVRSQGGSGTQTLKWAVSAILFLLAVLSKESAAIMPVLLIACWLASGETLKPLSRLKRALGGYGVTLLLAVVLHLVVAGFPGSDGSSIPLLDNPLAGEPKLHQVLSGVTILGRYAALALLPVRLSPDYSLGSLETVRSPLEPLFLLAVLFILVAGFLSYRYRRSLPLVFQGSVFFFAPLLVVSNILVPIGTTMAVRLLYLPLVGLCMVLSTLLGRLASVGTRAETAARVLAIVLVFYYGAGSYQKDAIWKNDATLFAEAVRVNPQSAKIQFNRGHVFHVAGDYERAVPYYRKAAAIYPDYARAENNLGLCLALSGDVQGGLLALGRAIDIDPEYAEAYDNRAIVYRSMGEFLAAVDDHRKAIALDADLINAYINLGATYGQAGELDASIGVLQEGLERVPDNATARYNLGYAFKMKGMLEDALTEMSKVVKANPSFSEAWLEHGLLADRLGRRTESIEAFQRYLELDPEPSGRTQAIRERMAEIRSESE